MPIRLGLMGMDLSNKEVVSLFLKEKYEIEVITKEMLIKEAVGAVKVPEEEVEGKKKKVKKVEDEEEVDEYLTSLGEEIIALNKKDDEENVEVDENGEVVVKEA